MIKSQSAFFQPEITPDQLLQDIIDIHKQAPNGDGFAYLEHYGSRDTQHRVKDVMQRYTQLVTQNGINPVYGTSIAYMTEIRRELLNLLHTETVSAVKVYQLNNVGQEAYTLGYETQEEHANNLWSQPIESVGRAPR